MKKVQVIWSAEALVDLETIYEFLANHSQQAAQNVIEKILSRARQIEMFPESGPQQALKSGDKMYRYLVEGNYRIADHRAFIATVFDTRYNPDKLHV